MEKKFRKPKRFRAKSDTGFLDRSVVNLDVTYLCALVCPSCQRQTMVRNLGKKVTGNHLSKTDFTKLLRHFNLIDFEGQYSDPVHHPEFIEFLELCYEHGSEVVIHNASSVKSKAWYQKAFRANPDATWVFAIDGLPEDSHKYRINQDGKKLFEIMVDSKNYLHNKPVWQYIVFKYNQDNIETAIKLAADSDISFYTIYSSRWQGENDPYMPSKKYRLPTI